jgi:hypothetical protein
VIKQSHWSVKHVIGASLGLRFRDSEPVRTPDPIKVAGVFGPFAAFSLPPTAQ